MRHTFNILLVVKLQISHFKCISLCPPIHRATICICIFKTFNVSMFKSIFSCIFPLRRSGTSLGVCITQTIQMSIFCCILTNKFIPRDGLAHVHNVNNPSVHFLLHMHKSILLVGILVSVHILNILSNHHVQRVRIIICNIRTIIGC